MSEDRVGVVVCIVLILRSLFGIAAACIQGQIGPGLDFGMCLAVAVWGLAVYSGWLR